MKQRGLVLCLTAVARAWSYGWPEGWNSEWPAGDWTTTQDCQVSKLSAYEMTKKGAVFFSTSPKDDFEQPKILPLNATAGEQWEFDGISDDGMASFIFGFYRDPNYAILGAGNFRTSIEITYSNGTRYGHVDYPRESIVERCSEGTRGIWRDIDYGYTFEITADMSRARIGIDTPVVSGNVLLKSRTKPRYADGSVWPSESASTEAAPFFHWVEPIPVGTVEVHLVINNAEYRFSGMSGHNRIWSAFSWFSCLQGMNAVRTMLGPYSLSFVELTSNIRKGEVYTSVMLAENGESIFNSRSSNVSVVNDYVLMKKRYNGKVTGTLRDKVTGYELELVSPGRHKHWTFFVDHRNVGFEYILGEGVGGSGFSGVTRGGHIGAVQFEGVALTEALTFPKSSPLFKSNYRDEL